MLALVFLIGEIVIERFEKHLRANVVLAHKILLNQNHGHILILISAIFLSLF